MIITKCVVVGESGVGKSSISQCYVSGKLAGEEHDPTIGIEFLCKNVVHSGKNLRIHIWDTAGQERFRSIAQNYFRDAVGALVCFSIINRKSFDNLKRYLDDLDEYSHPRVQKILVGTFSDYADQRNVSREEAQELADKLGMEYYEVSAKSGDQVNECFEKLIKKICRGYDIGLIEYEEKEIVKVEESTMLTGYLSSVPSCCNY